MTPFFTRLVNAFPALSSVRSCADDTHPWITLYHVPDLARAFGIDDTNYLSSVKSHLPEDFIFPVLVTKRKRIYYISELGLLCWILRLRLPAIDHLKVLIEDSAYAHLNRPLEIPGNDNE